MPSVFEATPPRNCPRVRLRLWPVSGRRRGREATLIVADGTSSADALAAVCSERARPCRCRWRREPFHGAARPGRGESCPFSLSD